MWYRVSRESESYLIDADTAEMAILVASWEMYRRRHYRQTSGWKAEQVADKVIILR